MAKTKKVKKPTRTKARTQAKAKPKTKAKANYVELGGETYGLDKPGETRRRHKTRTSDRSVLELDQKLILLDAMMSKFTANVSCEELEVLAMHVRAWAAELDVVHTDLNIDVQDNQIQEARLFYPSDPVFRLLVAVSEFRNRAQLSDDAAVDFVIMKLHGDNTTSAQLN